LPFFKLAVVLQQIFYRYHRGQTDDARFARLDERVTWLARIRQHSHQVLSTRSVGMNLARPFQAGKVNEMFAVA